MAAWAARSCGHHVFDWLAGQHSAVCHRPLLHVHVLLLLVLLRRRRCPFSSHSSWPRSAAASLSAAASAASNCRARAARKARQQEEEALTGQDICYGNAKQSTRLLIALIFLGG